MRKLIKRMPKVGGKRAVGNGAMQAPGYLHSATYPSLAGVFVSPEIALTFTAVYAARRVLSEDIASLPLEVFRRKGKDGAEIQTDHPVNQRLTVTPNGEATDFNWRESQADHVLGWGNAYAELEWSKGGELLKMHLLHPRDTEAVRGDGGALGYKTKRADGTTIVLDSEKVWHLAGLGFNGLTGYSPIALAREAIGLGKAAEQFGAAFFGNSARPSGLLKFPGRLSPDAKQRLRSDFNEIHQGSSNSSKIAILEEGLDWAQTQIPPEDAQFLQTRQFQVVEIARIYRLPPHKLGDFSQAHLANVEASNFDYLVTCLRPWLVRIEKSANLALLTEAERAAGYYTKHDMRALLRAVSRDRAQYYTHLRDLGVYTIDEIRALEELNPIGEAAGGNLRLVPVNLTSVEIAAQGGPAAMKAEALEETAGGALDASPNTTTIKDDPATQGSGEK